MHDIQFHTVLIKSITDASPSVKLFVLEFPVDITFIPGQFIILKFEGLQHKYDTRSYSISGKVSARNIELCVVLKGDGAATPLLFGCKEGDTLLSSAPDGRFILPEGEITRDMYFICTGTGVAPFRCMVKELLEVRNFQLPVKLFFGGRRKEDLLYRSEFEALEKEHPNFSYHPTLSRESWDGLSGYVHPHYQKEIQSVPNAMFYLCGWTDMIKEARDNIKALGYTRQDIKVEFYD